MTEQVAPQGTTSTLLPPSANGQGRSPPAPQARRGQPRIRISGMQKPLIAGSAALIVAVIFIIQNVHTANISFLGVHLVLPQAGALLLAAIVGSLLTVAAGPARITRLRQIIRRGSRRARANFWAYDHSPQGPDRTPPSALEAPADFFTGDQPGNTTVCASHVTD